MATSDNSSLSCCVTSTQLTTGTTFSNMPVKQDIGYAVIAVVFSLMILIIIFLAVFFFLRSCRSGRDCDNSQTFDKSFYTGSMKSTTTPTTPKYNSNSNTISFRYPDEIELQSQGLTDEITTEQPQNEHSADVIAEASMKVYFAPNR